MHIHNHMYIHVYIYIYTYIYIYSERPVAGRGPLDRRDGAGPQLEGVAVAPAAVPLFCCMFYVCAYMCCVFYVLIVC